MNGFVDLHTHILPGVDDGAKDTSQALALLRMAYIGGTRSVFLTPHYRGKYKNDPAWLQEVFKIFSQMVSEKLPGMKLYLGNEIYYENDAPEALAHEKILSLNNSEYALLEFHPTCLKSQVITGVSEMVRFGYTPIIAHAERYEVFRREESLADQVLDMGALIQLNADSVMGTQGFQIKRYCHRLLKARKVHFIASDAHDVKHRPPLLRECFLRVHKKYGSEYAAQVFYDNAQAVIDNRMI